MNKTLSHLIHLGSWMQDERWHCTTVVLVNEIIYNSSLALNTIYIWFKISLLTFKPFFKRQPVYFHSMIAASLLSCSARSNNGNRFLLAPRVNTNAGARAFHTCAPSLWNNVPAAVCAFSHFTCYPQETFEETSLTWPLYHRHQLTRSPVDVTEVLYRFSCRTPIQQSLHWAWLAPGYLEIWLLWCKWGCHSLLFIILTFEFSTDNNDAEFSNGNIGSADIKASGHNSHIRIGQNFANFPHTFL